MVNIVRQNGTPVWWLMAKDEGHGFNKKKNQDLPVLRHGDVCEGVFVEIAALVVRRWPLVGQKTPGTGADEAIECVQSLMTTEDQRL